MYTTETDDLEQEDDGGDAGDGADAADGGEDVGERSPITIMIEQLKSDDTQLRLNSMRQLPMIATALGPDRTRTELLPYLADCVEDEDDVLIALAAELGRFGDYIGGNEHSALLLPPLESLASVEEINVRDKAVETLISIAQVIPSNTFAESFTAMVKRLAAREWFTSRASAASLIPHAYPHTLESSKKETRGLLFQLCRDETPVVRRACISAIGILSKHLEPAVIKDELVPVFQLLAADEQDSVRLLGVDSTTVVCKSLPPSDVSIMIPTILACCCDKSWRVRYMAADRIIEISESVGPAVTQNEILNCYVSLFKDTEAEVRTASATHLAEFAGRIPHPLVVSKLVPCIRDQILTTMDPSQHVRAALAGVISSLAPILGRDDTVQYLVDVLVELLKDDFHEVRLHILSKLEPVHKVIGVEILSQALLPAFFKLAEDRQWRVKLSIIEYTPQLAQQLGIEFFNQKLNDMCLMWLTDPVFAIREAAIQNLKKLTQVFGVQWAQQFVIPRVTALNNHANYLHRMTTLFALTELACVVDAQVIAGTFIPLATRMAQDPVANVRFNVCKTMQAMIPFAEANTVASEIKPLLLKLETDPDRDVQYFAKQALSQCEL
ncbi:phosphoprotein phosphatase A [Pelomyxa schiedti]|nr:phosphoprotein phosphatase A [Pelomyxa schiedti]